MAAQSLWSMKVIVQPENASFVVATSELHQGSAYRDPVRLGGSQDQTVDRDQPVRHAGFALQPNGPVWSPDHVARRDWTG